MLGEIRKYLTKFLQVKKHANLSTLSDIKIVRHFNMGKHESCH